MKAYMEQYDSQKEVNVKSNRYPYCIVWTPLPLITMLIPFIGHTGICTSDGVIHDFSGSYNITVNDMAFGKPTKYVRLAIRDKAKWDNSIDAADRKFEKEEHNLCCNNCHSHVAHALNQAGYGGGGWNMVYVAIELVIRGRYTGFSGFVKTYIGFIVLLVLFIVMMVVNA